VKKTLTIAVGLSAIATLTACKKEAEVPKPSQSAAADAGTISGMPKATAMKHGMAAGTVTAIDTAKGTITLDHGAITGLGWPAMTMGFAARPEILSGIKIGDKVDFEIDWDGKDGTVTKIAKSRS
jgi:Cu/Ag efflux protein CusF